MGIVFFFFLLRSCDREYRENRASNEKYRGGGTSPEDFGYVLGKEFLYSLIPTNLLLCSELGWKQLRSI